MVHFFGAIAAANHKPTVWHARMVAGKLFGRDEVHGGVVWFEVVGHADDFGTNRFGVCTFSKHHVAFASVPLFGGELRVFARTHALNCLV